MSYQNRWFLHDIPALPKTRSPHAPIAPIIHGLLATICLDISLGT